MKDQSQNTALVERMDNVCGGIAAVIMHLALVYTYTFGTAALLEAGKGVIGIKSIVDETATTIKELCVVHSNLCKLAADMPKRGDGNE